MSALGRSQSALRVLLTETWRNSIGVTVRQLTVSSSSWTSAKPEEDAEQRRQEETVPKLDPFGIEEVVGSTEKSSILVQGFYPQQDRSPSAPPAAEEIKRVSVSPPPSAVDDDPSKINRLSKYDSWLKQRHEETQAMKSVEGSAESVREAKFGRIRVDSDNPVGAGSQQGDRDYEDYRLNATPNRSHARDRRRALRGNEGRDQEPIIETIEADHSTRMRASDFLDKLKGKHASSSGVGDEQASPEEGQQHRGKIVIERIMNPRVFPSMDPNDPENYASAQTDPTILDTNKIPKAYQMPDYNAVTEQDMWNILKRTIVFQNDFLLAINKPYGIPVHSKAISCRHTIIQHLKRFADLAKCEEVYPLHRIDKETTGVLLLAKDKKIAAVIKEKFAKREMTKVYLTATKLCPRVREATINIPIGEGKIPGTNGKFRSVLRPDLREYGISATNKYCAEAITKYKVLNSIKEAAFLEVQPITGLKHQIRVHLGLGIGCPVLGDHKYSHRDKLAPQRLHPVVLHKLKVKQSKVREIPMHLHCNKISFTLPKEFTDSTEPVYIHAKIPLFMKYTLRQLGLIR